MLIAFLLVAVGVVLFLARDSPSGLFLFIPGAVLWMGVVLYRMLTVTAENWASPCDREPILIREPRR